MVWPESYGKAGAGFLEIGGDGLLALELVSALKEYSCILSPESAVLFFLGNFIYFEFTWVFP